MAEQYICTGCYDTIGEDDGADFCRQCDSNKYFAWVEEDQED
jgi:hypothetical protein